MSNEIFIVTANDCTHCQTFRKSHLSSVLSTFTTSPKYKDITTREIHVENMGKKIVDYPEIDQYIGWYPTILYVKNRSQRNQSVLIFNGEISPTGSAFFRSRHPFNPQNIDKWLTDVHVNKILPGATPPTTSQQSSTPSTPSSTTSSQKATQPTTQTTVHPHIGDNPQGSQGSQGSQPSTPLSSSYACSFKIKPKR